MHSNLIKYRFYFKGIPNESRLKKQLDYAVEDILQAAGPNTDVQVSIEPESSNKKIFSVSMTFNTLGQQFVVKKTGHKIYPLIQKVKKAAMRMFKKSKNRWFKNKETKIKNIPWNPHHLYQVSSKAI